MIRFRGYHKWIIGVAVWCTPFRALADLHQEMPDAPQLLPGQPTFAQGSLDYIHGTLTDALDVDLYRISIVDPSSFSASVVGQPRFDAQLFLFNPVGVGVTHDDDRPPGGIFPSALGSAFIPGPGVYVLAISAHDRDPQSGPGSPLWLDDPVVLERPPDGPGTSLVEWSGTSIVNDGEYWIALTGCVALNPGSPPGQWVETADAPDVGPGQATAGSWTLSRVFGSFSDSLDADLFCIAIENPSSFSASASSPDAFDTQLFLFNMSGSGIAHDDDAPTGGTPFARLTGSFVPAPGNYLIGISANNRDAVSGPSSPIWQDKPTFVERPADGPGSGGFLSSWEGGGDYIGGLYAITLTGAKFFSRPPTDVVVSPYRLGVRSYPNPFNPSVTVVYSLPEASRVTLRIEDVQGRTVQRLIDEDKPPGEYSLTWNGRDDRGQKVASGIYFARLEAAGRRVSSKVILLE